MKTTQRGFIVPLLFIIVAILLAGGGAYFYTQTKSENPPVTENVTLPQATSTVSAAGSPITQSGQPNTSSSTFSASPESGGAPLTVRYSLIVSNVVGDYTINFGDGASGSLSVCDNADCAVSGRTRSTTDQVTHTYTNPGTYIATLVTKVHGGITVGTKTITVSLGTFSENEILASLKTNWTATQALISFRPSHPGTTAWLSPDSVQFIGKNNLLVRFEDGYNPGIAVLNFQGNTFKVLEAFKNQAEFTLSAWQNLVTKYGTSSYPVSTYTTSLVRNKQIVSYADLTKVPENVFVKN